MSQTNSPRGEPEPPAAPGQPARDPVAIPPHGGCMLDFRLPLRERSPFN